MSQPIDKCYLSNKRKVNAQANLSIRADLPEPSFFTQTKGRDGYSDQAPRRIDLRMHI